MDYIYHLAIIILIYAVMTVSLDLLIGHAGILSMGHTAFYGIGAYATAILTAYAGWDWFPAMVVIAPRRLIVFGDVRQMKGRALAAEQTVL